MLEDFNARENIRHLENEIKAYFMENGPQSKAIIGISGGKDSTITAALLVRALGKERVVGVFMPGYSDEGFKEIEQIRGCLGIEIHEMDITPILGRIYNDYYLGFNDTIDTNMPARIRMTILYMVAASLGGRVINTCNRSEEFVGYSTKYGDLAGDYGVLMAYTVSEIYAMGDAMTELPHELVHKVPADGMCGKTDEENLGLSYETIDKFLLDHIVPDFDTYRNMMTRHNRNIHKQCIQIPHPEKLPSSRLQF